MGNWLRILSQYASPDLSRIEKFDAKIFVGGLMAATAGVAADIFKNVLRFIEYALLIVVEWLANAGARPDDRNSDDG